MVIEMTKSRETKFELLRIICMLMIITGHIIAYHPSTTNPQGGIDYYIGNFVRSFVMVAVNCFVLISGYYGINFKIHKLFKLEAQIWFWSITLFIISILTGIQQFDIKQCLHMIFPIISKQWWYVTVYVVLFVLSPWLNQLVDRIKKVNLIKLLIILFFFFCIWPSFCYIINVPSITNDAGYGVVNFIFLYLIGRYIKLYFADKYSSFTYAGLYMLCCLGIFATNTLLTNVLGFYFNSFFSYDTIFCFVGSVMLFLSFKDAKFASNKISDFSKCILTVYIIHMHPSISKFIFENLLSIKSLSNIRYCLAIVIYPLIIFLICFCCEKIRLMMFGRMLNKISLKIEDLVIKLIKYLKITVFKLTN